MTSVPVPNILAWSSDPPNPVGAEYMILEKCPGRQLHTVWGELNELQRYELVKTIASFDGQMASIKFPVHGNLYLRASAPEGSVPLDRTPDSKELYCIGPIFNGSWMENAGAAQEKEAEAGPSTLLTNLS